MIRNKVISLMLGIALTASVFAHSAVNANKSAAANNSSSSNIAAYDLLFPTITEYNEDEFRAGFLESLGIIQDVTMQSHVTREQFSEILVKLLKMENVSFENYRLPYTDVASSKNIAVVHSLGLMVGYEDKFRPNDTIKLEEAAKTLCVLLGYEGYADNKGGYYSGYMATAANIKLTKGIVADEGHLLTWANVIDLVYNAINIKIAHDDYVNIGSTLLESNFDTYMGVGIVTATPDTALYKEDSGLSEGMLQINDKIFNVQSDELYKYLGYQVEYFYQKDGYDNNIIFAYPEKGSNETLLLTCEDELWTNGNVINYRKKSDSKSKSITLSNTADIIFNGMWKEPGSYLFSLENTAINFLDNNRDGAYDVAVVYEFSAYVVDAVSREQEKIFFKYEKAPLELDSDENTVRIIKNGSLVGIEEINEWEVLSLAASGANGSGERILTLIVSNDSVSGEIEAISEEDEEYIINAASYYLCEDFYTHIKQIKPGMSGVIYLDFSGQIVAFDAEITDRQYGFLYRAAVSGTVSKKAQMLIFTDKGSFTTYDLDDKVNIVYYPRYAPWALYKGEGNNEGYVDPVTGLTPSEMYSPKFPILSTAGKAALLTEYTERGNSEDIIEKYFYINGEFDTEKMQLIRYTVGDTGKITKIETAKDYGMSFNRTITDSDNKTVINEGQVQEDIDTDVFRLAYKANMFRYQRNTERPDSISAVGRSFRFDDENDAFYENITEYTSYDSAPVAVNTNEQPALFYQGETVTIFRVPRFDSWTSTNAENASNDRFTKEDFLNHKLNKNYYTISKKKISDNNNYTVDGYDQDEFSGVKTMVSYLSYNLSSIDMNDPLIVVDSIIYSNGEDGNTVQILKGYSDGELKTFEGDSETVFNSKITGKQYKKGDVIRIASRGGTNGKYNISQHIVQVLDTERLRLFRKLPETSLNHSETKATILANTNEDYYLEYPQPAGQVAEPFGYIVTSPTNTNKEGLFFGQVLKNNNSYIKMNFKDMDNGSVARPLDGSDSSIYHFSQEVKVSIVYRDENFLTQTGVVNDIMPDDLVLCRLDDGLIQEVVCYK